MLRFHKFLIVSSFFLTFGCGEGEEDAKNSEVVDAFFLTAADIQKPAGIKEIEQNALAGRLSDETKFYNNRVEGDSDDSDQCIDKLLAEVTPIVTDTSYKVGASFDISECMKAAIGTNSGVTIENVNFTYKVYSEIDCPSGGLAKYNENKASDTANNLECPSLMGRIELQGAGFVEMSTTQGGTSQRVRLELENMMFTGTASLGKCTKNNSDGISKNVDCVEVKKSKQTVNLLGDTPSTDTTVSWLKIVWGADMVTGLNKTDTWRQSGSAQVEIGNWSGTLTYSDKDTAPTYSMSNGSKTMEGSLTATATNTANLLLTSKLTSTQDVVRQLKKRFDALSL